MPKNETSRQIGVASCNKDFTGKAALDHLRLSCPLTGNIKILFCHFRVPIFFSGNRSSTGKITRSASVYLTILFVKINDENGINYENHCQQNMCLESGTERHTDHGTYRRDDSSSQLPTYEATSYL